MSNEHRPLSIVLDALSYPFVRFGWCLLIILCSAGFLFLVAISTGIDGRIFISGRIVGAALALIAVVVRCYFTIIEHTLTNWGKESWQSSSFDTDGLWGSLLSLFGLALISWAPSLVLASTMDQFNGWMEIVGQATLAFGCEYFCMGILALVVFNNFSQVLPHHILPAIFKSGPFLMLAGAALVLVPIAFEVAWGLLPDSMVTFVRALISSAPAAFFLIAHGRFIGLLYLANRDRIGWES